MTLATAKKIIALLLCTTLIFGGLYARQLLSPERQEPAPESSSVAPESPDVTVTADQPRGNFTDEMKIPAAAVIDEGQKNRERMGDHPGSPYFCDIDFYNAHSTDTLTILPHFRTLQQTSDETCGPACIAMVLDYYGKLGDWNEESLYELRPDHSDLHGRGVCLEQMIGIFEKVGGFELETTYDYLDRTYSINEDLFREYIEEGIPVLIAWSDRGSHCQVLIGYDTMGTPDPWDDVLILADPSDNHDHNQDGYTVYNAKRLIYSYTIGLAGVPDHVSNRCFIAPRLAE